MYYIIAAHGNYAQSCKSSCEMITGHVIDFEVVNFTEDMTLDSVEQQYNKILNGKGNDNCIAIITDLMGGTPYNAAFRLVNKKKNIELVAGLCQQLLILLNSHETLCSAMEQTAQIFLDFKKDDIIEKTNYVSNISSELAQDNGIVNLRLDERLIHGQVATYWTRALSIERIMIVDDEILKDDIGMNALKVAVPSGIHISILSVENAAKRLNKGIYRNQRVFVVVNKTNTIYRLLNSGLKIKEVNIGNMGKRNDRMQVTKSVYCTSEEINDIYKIEDMGVKVFAQMVPNDEKRTFKSYLGKGGK